MRFLGSIVALVMLLACNGGAQPPDSPAATGGTTVDTTPSGSSQQNVAPEPTNPNPNPTENVVPMPTATSEAAPTANPPNGSGTEAPTQPGGSCGGRTCGAGESCASYYGIAGPRGPMFHECVVRCRRGQPNDGCAAGKKCFTVADGPGDVCR